MEFAWSTAKRAANLKAHGLDFVDVPAVFDGLTFTFEDDRFAYGHPWFVGWHSGVHRSYGTAHEIRIISFRKATQMVHEPKMMPWGNRSVQFRDPEGTSVALFMPVTDAAKERFKSR